MQSEDVHPVSTAYLSAPPQDPPAPPPVTSQASGSLSAPQAAQWLDHVTTRLPVLTSRGMISKWDGQGILRWDLKLAGQWGWPTKVGCSMYISLLRPYWFWCSSPPMTMTCITTGRRTEGQSRKPRARRSQEQPADVMDHNQSQRS